MIATWGTFGVVAILAQAIVRLSRYAIAAVAEFDLSPLQVALAVVWTAANLYAEGYRGFQRAFAPRVVARAFYLARHPRPVFVILAPLYCLSLFHATRARLAFTYAFLACLVAVIAAVQALPQPWRGIVDLGVVAGLTYGAAAVAVFYVRALAGRPLPVPPDVP